MTEENARELFSQYIEKTLDHETRDQMQEYLSLNPACAAELIAFERTLGLLHRIPQREPVLDLWREFQPHLQEHLSERKRSGCERINHKWQGFLSFISSKLIIWTVSLAHRTHLRFERYLTHDPLHHLQHED